jgi:hypothetical protein
MIILKAISLHVGDITSLRNVINLFYLYVNATERSKLI